jgi:ribosomal protein S6
MAISNMMYEIMTVLPSRIADSEMDSAIEAVSKLIEQVGGKIAKTNNFGKMKLAYPMNGERYGTYVLFYAEVPETSMKKLDQNFRLADEVVRHMVIARPEGIPSGEYRLVAYTAPLTPEGRRTQSDDRVKPAKSASSVSSEDMDQKLDAILESDIVKNA